MNKEEYVKLLDVFAEWLKNESHHTLDDLIDAKNEERKKRLNPSLFD